MTRDGDQVSLYPVTGVPGAGFVVQGRDFFETDMSCDANGRIDRPFVELLSEQARELRMSPKASINEAILAFDALFHDI